MRWLLLAAVAIAFVGWGVKALLDREAPREVAPAPEVPPAEADEPLDDPEAALAAPAKARKPLDPRDRAKLVDLFRQYLDKRSAQAFEARIGILEEIKRQRTAGGDVLADEDALRGIVYAARPFEPYFEKGMLARDTREAEVSLDSSSGVVNVSYLAFRDVRRLSLSLPAGYAHLAEGRHLSETTPFPAIVTLHENQDYEDTYGPKRYPGLKVIQRRWDRDVRALRPVLESWFVFAPVAKGGRFVDAGRLKPERVPLEELWRRYHVDYDRIFLEGGSDALAFAAAQPNYLAGVIVRGATADMD
ncbi:MAG TPA: hypothetical protein VND21_03475, partial [Planctomycetota bacterium]|nr:hypothetical protein [Planctomycetota bacterium]